MTNPQAAAPALTAPAVLVNWKNPPSLRELKQDLADAKPSHDAKVAKITGWLRNLEEGGAAPAGTPDTNSKIAPKLIRKHAEWRYPALSEPFLSREDLFKVRPRSWEDRYAAKQNEMVLNYQFSSKIDRVSFIDEYVRTAVDEGTAIVRVGWEFEEIEVEEMAPIVRYVVDPTFGPTIEQISQVRAQTPQEWPALPEELREAWRLSQEQGTPVRPEVVGEGKQKKTKILANHPTLEVCDYRNVVLDPTCNGDVNKAGFIGYSFESSKSRLAKSGKYKNLEHINLASASLLASPDHAASDAAKTNFNFSDDARKLFIVQEYWGYWDVEGDGKVVPFVCAWVGDVMIRMELAPFPDRKLPFVVVQYLPKRRSTHGEPDGELLIDNQRVIGAVSRGMIDILGKSANGQTGMRKDMLDATNRRRFEKGLDYEYNANVDPRVGVHMHTYPEIPKSAQIMLSMQHAEAESLTGVKTFGEGVSGDSLGQVAVGVRGALDASSKREVAILRRLVKGMLDIARKIIAMNAEFLSDEEVVRVTNEDFAIVRRDDLAGEFDLKLSISTAEEDNAQAQELAFMLQTMGNNMDPGLAKIVLADIAHLRKMPDLAKRIETYQPQPDPMQQRMAELQVELLEAQVEAERSKAMLNMAQAQLSGQKVGTEQAKATHLTSAADKLNLDFIEQEAGVTQERNKELQGEQARSQAQLKILDHGFEREKLKADLIKEYVKGRMKNARPVAAA